MIESWFAFIAKHHNNASILGDKSSTYLQILPIMDLIFPNCKFLFTYRNLLDWILSYTEQSWNVKFDISTNKENLDKIYYRFSYITDNMKRIIDRGGIVVRFEDLCFKPFMVAEDVFSYLGVEMPIDFDYNIFRKPEVVGKWRQNANIIRLVKELVLAGYNLEGMISEEDIDFCLKN